jgi:hypothetical protein
MEKIKRRYILGIKKVIRPSYTDSYVDLELNSEGLPTRLGISISRETRIDEEVTKERAAAELKKKGFQVTSHSYFVEGTKQVNLSGKEGLKRLQEIAKRMMSS